MKKKDKEEILSFITKKEEELWQYQRVVSPIITKIKSNKKKNTIEIDMDKLEFDKFVVFAKDPIQDLYVILENLKNDIENLK